MYPVDVSYPPCLVALKVKPDTNILAVANYEHWDGIWPRAGFVKSLGPVGDMGSELEAMLQTLPSAGFAALPATQPEPDVSKHLVTDWDVVIHIDPPGCKDVDDVFCWKSCGPNKVIFSIGIADVAAWVPENSELDTTACLRGSTLYDDGVAVAPMFPTWLSESAASLRCDGNARPAVCLTYDLERLSDCEDDKVIWRVCSRPRFELHIVRVTESCTYDSIYEYADRAQQVRTFISAIWGTQLGTDSHEWVERAMILYNRTVGEELQHAGVGLLRTHVGATCETYSTLAIETGCHEIGWLGSAAGRYVRPAENNGHAGLSLACYTHASSPLRRYVDLYNQRWIRAIHFGYAPPTAILSGDVMNARAKRIRHLERDIYFLRRVLTRDSTSVIAVSGFVLTKSKKSEGLVELWRTYVPEWKRVVTCVIAHVIEDDPDSTVSEIKPGTHVTVRVYFNARQANVSTRFIYQAIYKHQNKSQEELS